MFGAFISNLPELVMGLAWTGLVYVAGWKRWTPISLFLGIFKKRS